MMKKRTTSHLLLPKPELDLKIKRVISNQSVNQSTHQPISHQWWINQSTINQLVIFSSTNQSSMMNKSVNHQSISQLVNQSVTYYFWYFVYIYLYLYQSWINQSIIIQYYYWYFHFVYNIIYGTTTGITSTTDNTTVTLSISASHLPLELEVLLPQLENKKRGYQ